MENSEKEADGLSVSHRASMPAIFMGWVCDHVLGLAVPHQDHQDDTDSAKDGAQVDREAEEIGLASCAAGGKR